MNPPPPDPPGLAVRDEIVPWIGGSSGEDEDDDEEEVVDESELFVDSIVDTGVTSGSDPSDWDPIAIDDD